VTAAAVVFLGVEHGILLAIGLSLLQHVRHGYSNLGEKLVDQAGNE